MMYVYITQLSGFYDSCGPGGRETKHFVQSLQAVSFASIECPFYTRKGSRKEVKRTPK